MASQDCAALRLLSEEEQQKQTTVTLTSSDGEVFEVEAAAARQSVMLRHMMELGVAEGSIALPPVSGDILALAVAYVSRHSKQPKDGGGSVGEHAALKDFDDDLVSRLDQATLIDLLAAANYMEIEGLLELTCQTVADMISRKTIEEVRQIFNIENDYTPEEEAEVRSEISWALN